jgi:hypothetical protein
VHAHHEAREPHDQPNQPNQPNQPDQNEKAPTPKGEGLSLPELDSNQQPAG